LRLNVDVIGGGGGEGGGSKGRGKRRERGTQLGEVEERRIAAGRRDKASALTAFRLRALRCT
jgi:hypothetical protein